MLFDAISKVSLKQGPFGFTIGFLHTQLGSFRKL